MTTAFRGLDPDGPLFLTGEGQPCKLIERRTRSGTPSYSCDSLSQLFASCTCRLVSRALARRRVAAPLLCAWRITASIFDTSTSCSAMKR